MGGGGSRLIYPTTPSLPEQISEQLYLRAGETAGGRSLGGNGEGRGRWDRWLRVLTEGSVGGREGWGQGCWGLVAPCRVITCFVEQQNERLTSAGKEARRVTQPRQGAAWPAAGPPTPARRLPGYNTLSFCFLIYTAGNTCLEKNITHGKIATTWTQYSAEDEK